MINEVLLSNKNFIIARDYDNTIYAYSYCKLIARYTDHFIIYDNNVTTYANKMHVGTFKSKIKEWKL